jgi:hypothetical protein
VLREVFVAAFFTTYKHGYWHKYTQFGWHEADFGWSNGHAVSPRENR